MRARLEKYFEFESLQASWKTEIVVGLTTFATIAYIIFVNPAILHDAGMPLAVVTAATRRCAGGCNHPDGDRGPISACPRARNGAQRLLVKAAKRARCLEPCAIRLHETALE